MQFTSALAIFVIMLVFPIQALSADKNEHSQSPKNPARWKSHQMNQPSVQKSDRYKFSRERIEEIELLLLEAEKELRADKEK